MLNRYESIDITKVTGFPNTKIPVRSTDVYIRKTIADRLDILAYRYYSDSTLYWIILLANPTYSLPDRIPNGSILRIPLPLQSVIEDIEKGL